MTAPFEHQKMIHKSKTYGVSGLSTLQKLGSDIERRNAERISRIENEGVE